MQPNKKANQSKKQIGRWAPDQHQRFMMAIATYGKDWKKVQEIVGTRSGSQVRSHAQKFFNKLLKEQTQKKGDNKHKKSAEHHQNQHQQSQISFLKYVHDDISNTTPVQLVSLIKGQTENNNSKKVDIKQFQTKLQERMNKQNDEDEQLIGKLQRQNSYKSMNNILEAYQTVKDSDKNNSQYQNQSFLMGLTKHYKRYFAKGGKFQNLIDFGNPAEVENFQKSIRKRSFTLPQGVEGDQQDLNERKKRVIAEESLANLNENQRQSFKHAMDKLNKSQKQQEKQDNKDSNRKQQNKEKNIGQDDQNSQKPSATLPKQ